MGRRNGTHRRGSGGADRFADSGNTPETGDITRSEQGIATESGLISRVDFISDPETGLSQRSDGPIPIEIEAKVASDGSERGESA